MGPFCIRNNTLKQIIQDLRSGETILADVPAPIVKKGTVLIKSRVSLVSLGTERMLVEFGKGSLLQKARQQPEKVRQVIEKIKTDGLWTTVDAVMKKLAEPIALGYCNAGEIIAVGDDVGEFKIGDRVVSNGPHAEVVLVPRNLVARIPDDVSYEEASFTVIGAVGLQGIRLINPTFGETITVIGLGLIGLISCQILKANGCDVVGYDFDQRKVDIAASFGITAFAASAENDPVRICLDHTRGVGVDGVLITASTQSNELISQAAQMSRKKGRIVLVGVIGLDIKRADFYEKELTFQVSCSYGPGRYDDSYEQKGIDYPLPYVRWTEKRNFEAILHALAQKLIRVEPLITQITDLENFSTIYDNMDGSTNIASLIRYREAGESMETRLQVEPAEFFGKNAVVGIIGSGNFAKMMIVPVLRKLDYNIKYIASERGLSSTMLARKYRIGYATTDYNHILQDPEVTAVIIAVRHDLHARLCIEALNAGKHVFVEKPLALSMEEIDLIEYALGTSGKTLTVGFNRRFSPFSKMAKELLNDTSGPISIVANMNAGFIPSNSWVHDPKVGGGRIVGEACHMIDLITFFCDSLVEEVMINAVGIAPDETTDCASILLKYRNGSIGTVNYFSNGSKSYPKERIEIYSQGRTIVIDNFRKLQCFGFSTSGFSRAQDKGHVDQFRLFLSRLKDGGQPLISVEQILNTSRASLAALQSLKTRSWVKLR